MFLSVGLNSSVGAFSADTRYKISASIATNKIKTHLDIRSKKHYIQGEFGVRLEDDIVITENGCGLLTVRMEGIEPIRA